MRIIAGRFGGLSISTPAGHKSHPMSEKMRGALFSALGDISGLSVLDAFGGSGAVGIEAASREAGSVLVIESDRIAQICIDKNIASLGANSIKLIKAKTESWLRTNPDATFDVIVADPPYQDLQKGLIKQISLRLSHEGVLVLSWPGKQTILDLSPLKAVKTKDYNDSQLVFYKQVA